MTGKVFNEKVASTLTAWVIKMKKKFQADLAKYGEKDARKIWREEYGLIFIKQYTVPARFRHYKPMSRVEMPEEARRTLYVQALIKTQNKKGGARSAR